MFPTAILLETQDKTIYLGVKSAEGGSEAVGSLTQC